MFLSTDISYGIAFVSVQGFETYRKQKKIRAKKMLSYFSQNNATGDDFLQNGFVLPIGRINLGDYYVSIGLNTIDIPTEYTIKSEWGNFNLCVHDDNTIWAVGLGELECWNAKKYEDKEYCKEENVFRYDPINKIDIPADSYCGIRFNVPKGDYKVKVFGVKNESIVPNGEGRYGYILLLTSTEKLTFATDATEVDFNQLSKM